MTGAVQHALNTHYAFARHAGARPALPSFRRICRHLRRRLRPLKCAMGAPTSPPNRSTSNDPRKDNPHDPATPLRQPPLASLGDWLNAHHHFSFGNYHDPEHMGFGRLRVWNDDEVAPGMGFDPHPHKEMEIVTYIRQGAITHRDNLGNEGRTEAGDVQVMHAGTGIVHAEYGIGRTF